MKNLSIWTLALAFVLSACGGQTSTTEEGETEYGTSIDVKGNLDAAASSVKWKGVMMGMYEHTGTVNVTEGSIEVDGAEIKSGKFTIDLSTISPTDENYDEEKTPAKLVGHLQSPDFFDVENFPNATFEITEGGKESVKGILTIRGKSNEETVQVEGISSDDSETWKIHGRMKFDRKKYDVAFDHPMQEMVISDEVELEISLVLN